MMKKKQNCVDIKERIIKTLMIVEERGYNLAIEKLSKNLIGGEIDINLLKQEIESFSDVDFDGVFVATSGNLQSEKCHRRLKINNTLQTFYDKIANEFLSDYKSYCPWIECVMSAGSMASEGLVDEDDIDLNIVVEDNTKYITWLLGILLCIKYSIKYRKQFNVRWFKFINSVVCICVIWENNQVLPFKRRDKQIAYELLLNSKVLYNKQFYNTMLINNIWLKKWFPQLYSKDIEKAEPDIDFVKLDRILIKWFFEPVSKFIIFLSYRLYRSIIFWNNDLSNRIDHVVRVQYPYAITDVPKKLK